jgi:hypothetical protein
MNCCDYDCTQGRDCPARAAQCPHCYGTGYDASGYTCTCVTAAEVAKVGRKYHDRDPLPANAWHVYMRHLAKWMLIALAGVLVAVLALGVTHA